ncbi:MAG: hypothetical protein HY298_20750 [Verrucomicrobia bacterium]|nr:hypothetical protein [Verrucomicrobiota bacterium]
MNTNDQNQADPQVPLREDQLERQCRDKAGHLYDRLEYRRTVVLSPEGAVVQKVWIPDFYYHCCHSTERKRGGCCGEDGCFNVSCEECFRRCASCNVGLCLLHAHQVDLTDCAITVCAHCRGAMRRRRFWRRFWSAALSPFYSLNETQK